MSLSKEVDGCRCFYPGSNATELPIRDMVEAIAANAANASSFYLDTRSSMSNGVLEFEGDDHHQAIARTHRLSDGSIQFFLAHSEMDDDNRGVLATFRYSGQTDEAHIVQTTPRTVAPMTQLLNIDEQHPADICFLPDVNNRDAGYLFVTEEMTMHRLSIYRWEPATDLTLLADVAPLKAAGTGPNLVFLDRFDDQYLLGVASYHWEFAQMFSAPAAALFPGCGVMDPSAFRPLRAQERVDFPVPAGACQVKLVRDATDEWFLLAFVADPDGDEYGRDFIDVYPVNVFPFSIGERLHHVHITFPEGATGFGNTGTHHVEPSGRLLVSTSYRWAEDEGPGSSDYVSRLDELPSG